MARINGCRPKTGFKHDLRNSRALKVPIFLIFGTIIWASELDNIQIANVTVNGHDFITVLRLSPPLREQPQF